PDQVVQTRRPGGADVHAGALPDRLEPLEDGDVRLGIGGVGPAWSLVNLHCHRRALSKTTNSRCESNPRTVSSGLSMRTHHSTRPTCQFGTLERSVACLLTPPSRTEKG